MTVDRKRIAIVGAGIAGLTCASLLADHHDVEVFEASGNGRPSRPCQMEGALNYLDDIPELEPTHKMTRLVLASENESVTFQGDLGWLYKIGGTDGLDAKYRREVARKVKMHHSTEITGLDMLSDYDMIVAADGYRSRIAWMAGMRAEGAELSGIGLGLTVKGDFETGTTYSLFHNHYAPGGYLYLIPMSDRKASLVSASIGVGIRAGIIRQRLREYAERDCLEIIDEWTDVEKWYRFHAYHRDNIYVIGSAASLTDRAYGFGLKYSIQSAKACAESILTGKPYPSLLKDVLSELMYWEKVGKILVDTTNREKDAFVRLAGNRLVRRWIESGASLRPLFRPLAGYIAIRKKVLRPLTSLPRTTWAAPCSGSGPLSSPRTCGRSRR